jgi:hypothetical protein
MVADGGERKARRDSPGAEKALGGAQGQQEIVLAKVSHASGPLGRGGPEAPKHVAPHRTLDGRAGILGDKQAAKLPPGPCRIGGIEPDGNAERNEFPVDSKASARR